MTNIRKARPTPGDVHVNAPLTNVAVAWWQTQTNYVADQIFPIIPVAKQSDLYYKWNKEELLRDEAAPRAPGTESAGGRLSVSTDNYSTKVEAFHKDIDDQLRENADSVLALDSSATRFVAQKLLTRRETAFFAKYFTTGVWGTDASPSTKWNAASSTPRADVDAAKMKILGDTGFMPNVLVIGPYVLTGLRSNAEVRDQFKYVSADSIDTAMLARFFGVDRVVVSNAVSTTTKEGAATQTTGFLAGKHALLMYAAPSPSILEPSAGYIFNWTGNTGSLAGMRIKRFRMEHLASDRIEGEMAYDFKVVATELGYMMNAAVS
jgi:hypothetical protein